MTDPAQQAAEELRELLTLTGEQHRIKRRIDLVRARVDARARTEYDTTGIAPTWKMPKSGQIRLDGCGGDPIPYVVNDSTVAEHIAQRTPDNAVATITVPADKLEAALEVLGFADVHVTRSEVTARDSAVAALLKDATLVDTWEGLPDDAEKPDPRYFAVDPDGQVIPGVSGRVPSAPRLVVAVDPAVKAALTAQADAEDEAQFPIEPVAAPEQIEEAS